MSSPCSIIFASVCSSKDFAISITFDSGAEAPAVIEILEYLFKSSKSISVNSSIRIDLQPHFSASSLSLFEWMTFYIFTSALALPAITMIFFNKNFFINKPDVDSLKASPQDELKDSPKNW